MKRYAESEDREIREYEARDVFEIKDERAAWKAGERELGNPEREIAS